MFPQTMLQKYVFFPNFAMEHLKTLKKTDSFITLFYFDIENKHINNYWVNMQQVLWKPTYVL